MVYNPNSTADLELALNETRSLWQEASGAHFFITGGTGFFGCWMLETLLHANRSLGLGISATVVTRDPRRFEQKAPHLFNAAGIHIVPGDMRDLSIIPGRFDFALHLATETDPGLGQVEPKILFESNLDGTRQFLALVRRSGVRKFLFTSSGAVYGPQPTDLPLLEESHAFAPDTMNPLSAYGESKRASELLCALEGDGSQGVEGKIARCFTFVGPYLPLFGNYAIGNFIRDALSGGPLRIAGDGTPLRSYLYGADLAAWLWTLLFRGRAAQAYNVGSEDSLSILELAQAVRDVIRPQAEILVSQAPQKGAKALRYIPSTHKARVDLGLSPKVGLRDAIHRTAEWHRC
ncbi:MAG: NAD(P)-dependent oxidoreductase [Opitutaceae bacterium]|jgi:dTDP-glucose 4,6-dehydratase